MRNLRTLCVTRLLTRVLATVEWCLAQMTAFEIANKLFVLLCTICRRDDSITFLIVILVTTEYALRLLAAIACRFNWHLTSSTQSRMTRRIVNMLSTTKHFSTRLTTAPASL